MDGRQGWVESYSHWWDQAEHPRADPLMCTTPVMTPGTTGERGTVETRTGQLPIFLENLTLEAIPIHKLTHSGRPIWMGTAEQHFPQITEERPDRSLGKGPWRGHTNKRRWGGQSFCSLSCHSRTTAKVPGRRQLWHVSLTRLTSRNNSCKYPTLHKNMCRRSNRT